jgi:hypothetical protein
MVSLIKSPRKEKQGLLNTNKSILWSTDYSVSLFDILNECAVCKSFLNTRDISAVLGISLVLVRCQTTEVTSVIFRFLNFKNYSREFLCFLQMLLAELSHSSAV